jgi:hypothetical protein
MGKQITTDTISHDQIRALLREAIAAGDYDQAAICDLALDGEIDTDDYTVLSGHWASRLRRMTREDACAECARVLAEARS